MIRCILFVGICASVSAYWGEIPETREIVEISVEHKTPQALQITVHSARRGRILLDLQINSEVITEVTKVYVVTNKVREERKPQPPCHYIGTVRNVRDSSVLISSCTDAFRGSISRGTEDTLYLAYKDNRYVIFSDSELPNVTEVMGADYNGTDSTKTDISQFLQKRFRRDKEEPIPTAAWRTLEVVVVTDRAMWYAYDTSIAAVEEYAVAAINHVDQIYRQYGIRLALVGIEVWRADDLIPVTPLYAETLRNFTMYRQEKLLKIYRGHDVSVLMTGVDFEGPVIGFAMVNNMCRSSTSNVNYDSKQNAKYFGTVIAHEIGHNFGMDHDTERCTCEDEEYCVMSAAIGTPLTKFSSCSKTVLNDYTGNCLLNTPKKLWGNATCGNGFVEEGEECDCGSYEECLTNDPCCEPAGCKLKEGSECYTGECCKDCKFRSYKTVCRDVSSECDLAEYCTGTDSQCPVNRFKQDGSDCAGEVGLCNYGSCQTRDAQCVTLWGEVAHRSSDNCYSQYNKKGEFYGNCGTFRDNLYIGCVGNNVMCGKLHCDVPKGTQTLYGNLNKQRLDLKNETCTVAYTSARRREDKASYGGTMVYDGTKCGDALWCKSGQCVEFVRTPCPSPNGFECGGYGSCNDLNQCHCNAGYDPQYNCAILLKVAGWDVKSILIAVMVIVLVVLPILIVGILVLRKRNAGVHDFFEHHTQIRFSVRLPSISRTASTIRKQRLQRQKSESENKYTPLRPAPAAPGAGPSGAAPHRPAPAVPGAAHRPAPPIPHSAPWTSARSSLPGSRPGSRPSSDVFDSPLNKRGPKVLQATTRDNVKLGISRPESARSLVNDRPLDDRMLAGSPLKDIQR